VHGARGRDEANCANGQQGLAPTPMSQEGGENQRGEGIAKPKTWGSQNSSLFPLDCDGALSVVSEMRFRISRSASLEMPNRGCNRPSGLLRVSQPKHRSSSFRFLLRSAGVHNQPLPLGLASHPTLHRPSAILVVIGIHQHHHRCMSSWGTGGRWCGWQTSPKSAAQQHPTAQEALNKDTTLTHTQASQCSTTATPDGPRHPNPPAFPGRPSCWL
jgi:hypothetical protein